MAEKQSMAKALERNKRLRQQLNSGADDPPSDRSLTVVNGAAHAKADGESLKGGESQRQAETTPQPTLTLGAQPPWVRHTLGLRPQTSLDLRDAGALQKQKKRRGLLKPGEPATEQEIADLGINWALEHIGFKQSDQG